MELQVAISLVALLFSFVTGAYSVHVKFNHLSTRNTERDMKLEALKLQDERTISDMEALNKSVQRHYVHLAQHTEKLENLDMMLSEMKQDIKELLKR